MKKLFLIALVLLVFASAAACGGSSTPPAASQEALDAMQQALAAVDPADPASVVLAHFAARNAFAVDQAMTLVADDAVFSAAKDTATGAAAVRQFVQDRVNQGFVFTLANVQPDGENVAFTAVVTSGGKEVAQLDGKALVVSGKIKNLETIEK